MESSEPNTPPLEIVKVFFVAAPDALCYYFHQELGADD